MKAFDAIDNDVLLQESCAIGFSKCTVNWFESYISIRSLSVNLGSNFSQLTSLFWGFPQGFILNPLLLSLYISYMLQAVKCDIFLFNDEFVLSV